MKFHRTPAFIHWFMGAMSGSMCTYGIITGTWWLYLIAFLCWFTSVVLA